MIHCRTAVDEGGNKIKVDHSDVDVRHGGLLSKPLGKAVKDGKITAKSHLVSAKIGVKLMSLTVVKVNADIDSKVASIPVDGLAEIANGKKKAGNDRGATDHDTVKPLNKMSIGTDPIH